MSLLVTFEYCSSFVLMACKVRYSATFRVAFAGCRKSIPGRDRPKSLKQEAIAPLPNARQ